MTDNELIAKAVERVKRSSDPDSLHLLIESLRLPEKRDILSGRFGFGEAMARVGQTAQRDIKLAKEYYEIAHRFALFCAPEDFDMFMIACEWLREPNARFYLPRRGVLEGRHRLASRLQSFIDDPGAKFMSISMPPGTGKTTVIKFLLAYIIGRAPKDLNMYVSYADRVAKAVYQGVSGIITDKTEYCYDDVFHNGTPTVSAEDKTISYRRKGEPPALGCASIDGSVTGITRANAFLITDDLVRNAEEARSPERLETLYQNYQDTVTSRMIGDRVKQIMLGTIWSVHDPISRTKREHEGEKGYIFFRIPVCDRNGRSNFNYDHPDNYTDERIAEIRKNMDPVTFRCLYLQDPVERGGLMFAENTLRFFNGVLPEECDEISFVCDVAYGGGDSLSMPVLYVCGQNVYVPDLVFSKGDKSETQPEVVDCIVRNSCQMGEFERNNGGDMYAERVDQELRNRGYVCNITSRRTSNKTSKLARIQQYSPDIRQRFIFLDRDHRTPEYSDFMEELCSFLATGKSPHDDAPDSLALAAEYLARKFGAAVEFFRKPF